MPFCIMKLYKVIYKIDGAASSTTSSTVLNLEYGSEGEALEKLLRQGTVSQSQNARIISVVPA